MEKILIIGATSAIAEATARLWAGRQASIYLLGRNSERLQAIAQDLTVRGAVCVGYAIFDASIPAEFPDLFRQALAAMGECDTVLVTYGTLPDQKQCEGDAQLAERAFHINAVSTIMILTTIANYFEGRGEGTLGVISSVAGDRGRASNYVYGSAKGAVSLFLSGLRSRLHKSGVHVVTIKPGFVDTPMTAAFPKGPLWAKPEAVAVGIVNAMDAGRDTAYLPWFWKWIMLIIRMIPEQIFKRLNL